MSKANIIVRTHAEYEAAYNARLQDSFTSWELNEYNYCMKLIFEGDCDAAGKKNTREINKAKKTLNMLLGFEPDPIKEKEKADKVFLKTVVLLCEHMGENAPTTRTPRRLWVDGQDEALLEELVWRCIAFDNDGHIQVPRWEKRTVEIPVWMPVEEFISSYGIDLRWYLGFDGQISWPESWYRKLIRLGEEKRYAVIQLLNQKSFRSPKRQEMRNRFEAWLNGEGELGKYDMMDVNNEYTDREAQSRSHHLYWSK